MHYPQKSNIIHIEKKRSFVKRSRPESIIDRFEGNRLPPLGRLDDPH
jgi:hypothetical protein